MKSDLPHILLTHSPVFGPPAQQTGFPDTYHSPDSSFTTEITSLADKHANIECVLGAHNHMNMHIVHNGVNYATVSSIVETPFEFKMFEVTPKGIAMTTVALNDSLDFCAEYDTTKSFVQGRPIDRSFSKTFEILETDTE